MHPLLHPSEADGNQSPVDTSVPPPTFLPQNACSAPPDENVQRLLSNALKRCNLSGTPQRTQEILSDFACFQVGGEKGYFLAHF